MESVQHDPHRVSAAPLIAIAALVACVLAAVTFIRVLDWTSTDVPAPAVVERLLHFEDLGAGRIAVTDADTGEALTTFGMGEQGFMRATVRGLAQERLRRSGSAQLPFLLSGREDGRLLLEDPVTGRRIDLTAFGPTNAAVFARLLPGVDVHP